MKSTLPSKLIVGVMSMLHVMELNKTADSKYEITGGVEGMLLKILMERLGVEYELVAPEDVEYGRKLKNGSYTGLIGMLQRGDIDMASGGLAIVPARQKVIDFSPLYDPVVTTFAIKKADKFRLKNAYLYPFSYPVWACYFAVLFATTVALRMVLGKKYTVGRVIFELCGNSLRQPFMLIGDSWNSKVLLAAICTYTLVITSSYSGVLLSFMTVPVQGETVETIEQLSAAVARGTHRCYAQKGNLMVPYLLAAKDKNLNVLGKAIQRNKWYLVSMDEKSLNMISTNDAIISNSLFLNIAYHGTPDRQSKYVISSDSLGKFQIGLALNRNFCCKKRVNRLILHILEAGMYTKSLKDTAFLDTLKNRQTEEEVKKENKISYDDISGALVILLVGYAISFITLLAEIFLSKYSKNARHT